MWNPQGIPVQRYAGVGSHSGKGQEKSELKQAGTNSEGLSGVRGSIYANDDVRTPGRQLESSHFGNSIHPVGAEWNLQFEFLVTGGNTVLLGRHQLICIVLCLTCCATSPPPLQVTVVLAFFLIWPQFGSHRGTQKEGLSYEHMSCSHRMHCHTPAVAQLSLQCAKILGQELAAAAAGGKAPMT